MEKIYKEDVIAKIEETHDELLKGVDRDSVQYHFINAVCGIIEAKVNLLDKAE